MPTYSPCPYSLVSLLQEGTKSYQKGIMNRKPVTNPMIHNGVLPQRYARSMETQTCRSNQPISNLSVRAHSVK